MSTPSEIKEALREWAQGASGSDRLELRTVLVEVADELQPSIAERIRGATGTAPTVQQSKPREQTRQFKTVKKTPKSEQQNQIDWVISYLRDRGPTKVSDLVSEMLRSHSALQNRPAPNNTAVGRLRTAVSQKLIEPVGGQRLSGIGLLRISMDDVMRVPVSNVKAERPAFNDVGAKFISRDNWPQA